MKVVDLFAGPGGWDLAAAELGIDVLGVEFDQSACDTREAAGLRTLQADVGALDPADFEYDGLIASPPCQAFSMAGKGEGRKAIDEYIDSIRSMPAVADERAALDWWNLERSRIDDICDDERAHLVLEPLRWVVDAPKLPDWIALEQVEPVLPIWQAMADVLMDAGYYTWTGVLSAEQYGVPQTRRRAFLIARRRELGIVNMPQPTHQRYIPPRTKTHDRQEDSLFSAAGVDVGDRQRIVHPSEKHLLPWVSMAEALGWRGAVQTNLVDRIVDGETQNYERDSEEPSPTVSTRSDLWQLRAGTNANDVARDTDEPAPTLRFGARLNDVSFIEIRRGGDRINEGFDPNAAPSEAITTRTDRWQLRANKQANAAVRDQDEPAPAITGGHDTGDRVWEPTHLNNRDQTDGRTGEPNRQRPVEEPAPTIAGESRNDTWVGERPATTVAGDPRIAEPGHKKDEESPDSPGRMTNAVRVTQQQAAVLQSFPPNYPWQGSKTKQFQQIGNAVPPLLALAVLRAVVPAEAVSGDDAA